MMPSKKIDYEDSGQKKITIISGERNMGKTHLCKLLVDELLRNEKKVDGILSPGVFESNKKIEIYAQHIASGQKRIIARFQPGYDKRKAECDWRFVRGGMQWANRMFAKSVPTDYLFVDEVGFLELERNSGWSNAIKAVESGLFIKAFVVVRPSLIDQVNSRWPIREIVFLKQNDDLNTISIQLIQSIKSD